MLYFRALITIIIFSTFTSCIALRKDVDVAVSQMRAENNAKIKIVEDKFKIEIEKITKRLDEIEKTLQIDKKAAENKINLSFNTLDDLKATIRDINNRIDSVDITAQQNAGFDAKVSEIKILIKTCEDELVKLRTDVFAQLDELKPVENMTVTKNGIVRLPENEEKSYNQLVDFTRSSSDGAVARKGWEVYSQKWPKNRKCDVVYWIGETYFLEKSYNSAIEYFGKIESEFSSCSKLEASYIRTAYSLFYTEKDDIALKVLEVMKIKFPKTSFSDQIKELRKMIAEKSKKKKAPVKNEQNPKKGDKK